MVQCGVPAMLWTAILGAAAAAASTSCGGGAACEAGSADEAGDVALLQMPAPAAGTGADALATEPGEEDDLELLLEGEAAGLPGDKRTPAGGGSDLDFKMLKRAHDSDCSTVFLTTVLGTRKDPQRKIHKPPTFEYFERYYRSILSLPGSRAKAVILHDFLSDEVTQNYTTKDGAISFVKVDISGIDPLMGLNDLRYQLFDEQIKKHPEWDTVFMTDIADVLVIHNPCMLVEENPDKLIVGSQSGWMKPYAYIHQKFEELGGEYLAWYEGEPRMRWRLLNAGIMGGKRARVLEALSKLNKVLLDPEVATRKNGSSVTINMAAFNYVFHRLYEKKDIMTGSPVHSKFWSYQNRTDVYFRHK